MTAHKLGLTGGIGSGKTTVAGLFAKLGATVIDADVISRQSSAAGGAALPAIARAFGVAVLAADGSLNREAMRELVFNDPKAKALLESIVHPIVKTEIDRLEQSAMAASAQLIVFDIPLLVESADWRSRMDSILVVDCLPQTQIARVIARNGWPLVQIEQVLASQASRAQRLAAADHVICNDKTDLATLAQQVRELASRFGL